MPSQIKIIGGGGAGRQKKERARRAPLRGVGAEPMVTPKRGSKRLGCLCGRERETAKCKGGDGRKKRQNWDKKGAGREGAIGKREQEREERSRGDGK